MRAWIVYTSRGKEYYIEGRGQVSREEFDRLVPSREEAGEMAQGGQPPFCAHPTCWPMRSEALAVHPSQVEEANERNRRHGIATRYEPDGTAVIPTRGDRKRLLRLEGFVDRNGGYGD